MVDAIQELPPRSGTRHREPEDVRAGLIAGLRLWASRRSPCNVAHQLGISMARVREMRAGRFDGFSTAALALMANKAGLET